MNIHFKKLLIFTLITVLLFTSITFFSCSEKDSNSNPNVEGITIVIEVQKDDLIFHNEFTTTARTLAEAMTEKNLAKIETDYYDYVYGLYANGNAYWALYINGQYAEVGADDLEIHNNDIILWEYKIWRA